MLGAWYAIMSLAPRCIAAMSGHNVCSPTTWPLDNPRRPVVSTAVVLAGLVNASVEPTVAGVKTDSEEVFKPPDDWLLVTNVDSSATCFVLSGIVISLKSLTESCHTMTHTKSTVTIMNSSSHTDCCCVTPQHTLVQLTTRIQTLQSHQIW